MKLRMSLLRRAGGADRDLRWGRRIAWSLAAGNLGLTFENLLRREHWWVIAAGLIWTANSLFYLYLSHLERRSRDYLREVLAVLGNLPEVKRWKDE